MNRQPEKMLPATLAVKNPRSKRLVLTRGRTSAVVPATGLAQALQPGDMLVYNNSSVLPARFRLKHPETGKTLEMRLARALAAPGPEAFRDWRAVLWHDFTWRERTENRRPLTGLTPGTTLTFDTVPLRTTPIETAKIRILRSYPFGMYDLSIENGNKIGNVSETPLALLLRLGQPIQYSYHVETLKLWDIQTLFTGPPLSLEPPSAAFILDWETVAHLRRRGVELVPISHAAGISSVGTALADQQLPLPERSYLPAASAARLNAAKAEGRHIVALGTTVARSLETAARLDEHGNVQGLGNTHVSHLKPGWFETRLRLGPKRNGMLQKAMYCDALITGLHDETESHFLLEQAFISRERAESANALAASKGLRHHEFGDFHYLEKDQRVGSNPFTA
jgi:S-adenosylmethionine:tRNA ribosyltransferase-isomerase